MTNRIVDFRSDNVASVSPEILAALAAVNEGPVASYGADQHSQALNRRFSRLFETDVTVFPVATGTAANALALAACTRPWGGVWCHEHAHIQTSEGGATEMFTGGAKLVLLPGEGFRLQAATLDASLRQAGRGARHKPQPDIVSLTQASEHGTVYRLDELRAIGAVAREHKMRLHMDGARFANALATLGCTAAEMTTGVGVDILSFGATKNGCMNTEAIVVFDKSLVEGLSYRLSRAGHTWSKMRYAAAQLIAYVENDLYLRNASRSNALATRLAEGLKKIEGASLVAQVEADILFVELPAATIERMASAGVLFHRYGPTRIRLVTRFDGSEADIDRLLEVAGNAHA